MAKADIPEGSPIIVQRCQTSKYHLHVCGKLIVQVQNRCSSLRCTTWAGIQSTTPKVEELQMGQDAILSVGTVHYAPPSWNHIQNKMLLADLWARSCPNHKHQNRLYQLRNKLGEMKHVSCWFAVWLFFLLGEQIERLAFMLISVMKAAVLCMLILE